MLAQLEWPSRWRWSWDSITQRREGRWTVDGEIRVIIRGDARQIDAVALQRALTGLLDLVRKSPDERWVVSELRLGSIVAAVAPADIGPAEVEERFRHLISGIDLLTDVAEPPVRWTDEMLQGLATFGTVLPLPGVDAIEIRLDNRHTVPITRELAEHASRALARGRTSFGSVEGVIDRFYDRDGKREFGLRDRGGDAVSVRFKRADSDRVRECIGQRVVAWGRLKRNTEGRKRELKMDGFDLVQDLPSRLTLDDVIGTLGPDWTEGRGSVQWIREQRDGD